VWKTGFTDSGRESININDNALQKNVTKNIVSEDLNTQTLGVNQTQFGVNEIDNQGKGQKLQPIN
jgi:hypothetical protein